MVDYQIKGLTTTNYTLYSHSDQSLQSLWAELALQILFCWVPGLVNTGSLLVPGYVVWTASRPKYPEALPRPLDSLGLLADKAVNLLIDLDVILPFV